MFTWFTFNRKARRQKRWIVILNRETTPEGFVRRFKALSQDTFYDYVGINRRGGLSIDRAWYQNGGYRDCLYWATLCNHTLAINFLKTNYGRNFSMNSIEWFREMMDARKKNPEAYKKVLRGLY